MSPCRRSRAAAMLELVAVRHRYDGRVVLDIERFAVAPGSGVAIVGPNGSGKSTLLRLLALLERPSEGEVRLDGVAVTGAGPRRRGITPLLHRRRHELSDGEVQRVAVARALAVEPDVLLLDEPASSADRAAAQTLYRALAEERARRPLAVCLASHQLEDAYRWADDVRALAEGKLSPVTPENLFRVDLPVSASGGDLKHVCVGTIEIAATTDKTGPAILAVPPTDIFVSREPLASSARNVFTGRVTRLSHQRPGTVQVTADVGVELVAVVTEEAARDLGLTPGGPVVFSFKASAVRVF